MKTLKHICAVLFSISLCAASVSCAHQTGGNPPAASEPAATAAAAPMTTAAETTTEPTTAEFTMTKPTTTKPQTTAKPTTKSTTAAPATKKPAATSAKPTTTKPKTTAKPTEKATTSIATYEAQALRLTNKARQKAGLKAFGTSAELQKYADIRAKEIKQKFSHTRPNGQDCFSLDPDLIMGENIACGQTTPQEAVDGWMASKGHRENILRERFTLCAVGCYYDKNSDTYYWVQLFG
ncbi:MAG: CAP domain-containing protein [Clostridia bacterium]|nr:CAP domain-containing protein [Clostridia bacterium]